MMKHGDIHIIKNCTSVTNFVNSPAQILGRLKIHMGSKIDLEIGAHSHFHLLYMMKRAGMLQLLRASF